MQQVSKKQKVDPLVLGDSPQMIKCPYCLNQTVSNVNFQNGYLSYISCFFVLLAFGLLPSFLFIPVIMLLTKQLVHRCAVCNEEIGNDGKIFHAIGLKDSMLTFKIGEMGCILTRKIFLGLVLLFMTLCLLAYRIHTLPENAFQGYHHHNEPNITISDTWPEFLEKCPREKYLTDFVARRRCEQIYMDRTVTDWKGYVIRVEDYRQSLLKYLHHAVTILVRMDPQESEFHPDILLTMDSESAELLGEEIEKLSRGSYFSFSAIIKSLGDLQHGKHFHLKEIKKEEGYKEIPIHLHDHGRYATPGFLKGTH